MSKKRTPDKLRRCSICKLSREEGAKINLGQFYCRPCYREYKQIWEAARRKRK